MVNLIVLSLLFLVGICRWVFIKGLGQKGGHILISLLVQTLPFAYGKGIYSFLQGQMTEDYKSVRLGEFGNIIRIEFPVVFLVIFFALGYHRFKSDAFNIKKNIWLYVLLAFCVVSYLNPYNTFPLAFLVLAVPLFQFLLVIKYVDYNFSRLDILKGIFDGLMMITLLEFVLAICYPVLGLEFVATLFRDSAFEWSQRRGMTSAIGTFGHPGHLALYSLIMLGFFVACYLNRFNRKWSGYLILFNSITLILTFSRTTLICTVLIMPILILIYKQGKKIFSLKSVIAYLTLFMLLLAVVYVSPLSYLFLESDSNVQVTNRFVHWTLGYQMWEISKWIGVGINTHVYYMLNKLSVNIAADITLTDTFFFLRSPIHNIHVIVLAEAGMIGLGTWFYFYWNRFVTYYKYCRTANPINNIFNLTFICLLLGTFLYGFFGWTPMTMEIYSMCLMLGYFAKKS